MPLPVTCPACGKSFSISDDVFEQKIKGRVVTVKCKQCQAPIRVDGTKGLAAAKVGPVPAATAPAAAPAPAAAAAAPEPAAPAPEPVVTKAEPAPEAVEPKTAPVAEPVAAKAPPAEPAAAAEPPAAPTPAPEPAAAKPPAEPVAPSPASPVAPAAAVTPKPAAAAVTPKPAAAAAAAVTPKPAPAATPPAVAPKAGAAPFARGASPRTAPTTRLDPTPVPAAATSPAPAAVGSAPTSSAVNAADTNLFAVDLPGGDREFTETQIADQLSKGKIGPDTLVWREGMAEWLEIRKVPELARHIKKVAAKPVAGETPALPKAAPAAAKPAATTPSSPSATGRFRPRQPTLPMGMLPDAIQAGLPQGRPVETPAALAGAATPPAAAAPPAAAPPPVAPAPPAAPPTPASRLPAIPAARAAAPAASAPVDREGPAGFAARERAAALLKTPSERKEPERKETPRVGSLRAQLPTVPIPEQILDEDPTILRASPFSDDATPAPRAPLPTPVRELLARQGQGDAPSAPRAAPSERKFPSPPPSPPSPPSRPVAVPARNEPTPTPHADTYRATPEAKRSWFPEPSSEPPPPAPPALSSPFPVGAARPAPPSAPFGAPVPSAPMGAPVLPYGAPNPAMAAPTAPVNFDELAAMRGKKKPVLWIILGVMAVVAIGVAIALLSGGPEKLPPPAPTPEPRAAPAPAQAPTSEVTTAQPPAGSNPSPGEAAEPSAPTGGGALPGAPGGNAPGNAPGGGFAEMFAQGAKQAGGPGTGHFDAAAAKTALDALLTEAARCREPGGPQGIARVAVTFAPNGGVSSATIAEPPFAGSSVGNCICEAMKRARIKPFSGPPGNLTERISIR